jgi:hypothetical protein
MAGDLPDYTKLISVNVEIPEVEVGPVNVGRYAAAPSDLPDGTRTPVLTDVKGRLIIVQYEKDRTVETAAGKFVRVKGSATDYVIVSATDLDIRDLTSASDSVEVKQATRTNLLNKPEREDLLLKSFDLAVGTTSLLAAVAGQHHKVYGWDYEADTDGANEFSGTFGGSTYKFARRVTKGVHAMTLVHPIICDVNTALSFISAGNTKLSLRYKTEA